MLFSINNKLKKLKLFLYPICLVYPIDYRSPEKYHETLKKKLHAPVNILKNTGRNVFKNYVNIDVLSLKIRPKKVLSCSSLIFIKY